MFKVGDKIRMIKECLDGWYGQDNNRVKFGDVITIKNIIRSKKHEYDYAYIFHEFDGEWLAVEDHFKNITEDREKKLKRILYV